VSVRGWALDPLDPEEVVEVTIMLDGEELLTAPADRERPDVVQQFGVTSGHGFLLETRVPHAGRLALVVNTNRGRFEVHSRAVP
jgi:hypothetical protein